MNASLPHRLAAALCGLLLLSCLCAPARAAQEPVTVLLHGAELVSDSDPFILNGTAYVSLSAFARTADGTEVTWDGSAARIRSDDLTMRAAPGQVYLEANGRTLHVPDEILLTDGRTMIPVRTAAALFGLQVQWDADDCTVHVSDGGQPLEPGDTYYDADTLFWLSRVISAESRGEPLTGQIAVGNVALNRVDSPHFPDTLYGVIFQPGQFEPVENGTIYNEPYHLSVTAAKLVLEGAQVVGDCLYFFAPELSPGTWIVENRTFFTSIGCHNFYL